jgi:hypothetical protein
VASRFEIAEGRRSWRGFFRQGVGVRDTESGDIVAVRSRELAERIAELLNADAEGRPPPRPRTDSPFRTYECIADYRDPERALVLRVFPAASEVVAWAPNRPMGERIADLLNRVEPHRLRRLSGHGIGWW